MKKNTKEPRKSFVFYSVICDHHLPGSYSCYGDTVNIFSYLKLENVCVCLCVCDHQFMAVSCVSCHLMQGGVKNKLYV